MFRKIIKRANLLVECECKDFQQVLETIENIDDIGIYIAKGKTPDAYGNKNRKVITITVGNEESYIQLKHDLGVSDFIVNIIESKEI